MPLFSKFKFWEETKIQREIIFLVHEYLEKNREGVGTSKYSSNKAFSFLFYPGIFCVLLFHFYYCRRFYKIH